MREGHYVKHSHTPRSCLLCCVGDCNLVAHGRDGDVKCAIQSWLGCGSELSGSAPKLNSSLGEWRDSLLEATISPLLALDSPWIQELR